MDNQVGFDGFQVSNQCMALVRDDCLVPTIDEPGLGYIRESSSDQYVPDVFYKVGVTDGTKCEREIWENYCSVSRLSQSLFSWWSSVTYDAINRNPKRRRRRRQRECRAQ